MLTFKRVCAVFSRLLECEEAQLDCSTELAALKLDSFETVELIASLEEEFAVKIKIAYIKKLKTIGDVVQLVDALNADG